MRAVGKQHKTVSTCSHRTVLKHMYNIAQNFVLTDCKNIYTIFYSEITFFCNFRMNAIFNRLLFCDFMFIHENGIWHSVSSGIQVLVLISDFLPVWNKINKNSSDISPESWRSNSRVSPCLYMHRLTTFLVTSIQNCFCTYKHLIITL